MKTIIVSTDFSPASINALNYAADMALTLDAELLLFNTYNIPLVYTDGPVIPIPIEELKEGSEKGLEQLKEYTLRRLSGKRPVTTSSRMGNVVEELETLCRSVKPFAVVIGSRGKSNFERTVFGSSTLSIIKHLTWPVICVSQGEEFGKGISKIAFACDFKEVNATTPFALIRKFVKGFKAELYILNVDHNDRHFGPGSAAELFVAEKMFQDDKPHFHFIDNPDLGAGINEFVYTHKIDLLIAVPKKHTVFEKIFKESNTKQLIARSIVPMMCVHE